MVAPLLEAKFDLTLTSGTVSKSPYVGNNTPLITDKMNLSYEKSTY
ncbi:MAG: hypothetical protein KKG70_03350 [Proteobacteria bacterium]|nr:hypothetical protein [Pseudomonadota bacterium]